jgi:hypothetical protein
VKLARILLATLAALALAATLALLAFAAPAASTHPSGAAVYCPDKASRQADANAANLRLNTAKANASVKAKALAKAKRTGSHVAAAKKANKAAQARLRDAEDAQHGAAASLAQCD